jgi:hypothetical protein
MTSIYFIGGTGEFSRQMTDSFRDDYGYEVTPVGRRTGHGVDHDWECNGLNKIADEFLKHDVIVNFVYSGGVQYPITIRLLKEILANEWKGYFINFGSTALLHNKGSMDNVLMPHQHFDYIAKKTGIHAFSREISKSFMTNDFRYTLINCGMLDNEKMRQLPKYRPTCLKPSDLTNLINYCINTPSNWHLHELYLDAK